MTAVGWRRSLYHWTLCDFSVADSAWLDAEHWPDTPRRRDMSYCTAGAGGAKIQFAHSFSRLNGDFQVTLELGRADVASLFLRTFGQSPLLGVLGELLPRLPDPAGPPEAGGEEAAR